jgi:hypothetical protein
MWDIKSYELSSNGIKTSALAKIDCEFLSHRTKTWHVFLRVYIYTKPIVKTGKNELFHSPSLSPRQNPQLTMIKRLQKIIFSTYKFPLTSARSFTCAMGLCIKCSRLMRGYILTVMIRTRTKWQTHLKKFGRYKNFMKVVSIRRYNAKVLFTKNIYIQIIGDVIDYRTQNMLINWYLHNTNYQLKRLESFSSFYYKVWPKVKLPLL